MIVPKSSRHLAQTILNLRTGSALREDGDFWTKSIAAAQKWIPWTFKGQPTGDRWVAAVIQKEAALRGINAGVNDAYYGPQTDDAADRIDFALHGKPLFDRPDENPEIICPPSISIIKCWNPSTAQFRALYGREGENQGMVASPYPLVLDWDLDTTVHRFSAHERLVPRIQSAMQEVLAHYGLPAIERLYLNRFGGCLNVRPKRGGTTPSVHSWGAALDWYPTNNRLKQDHSTAVFARQDYTAWFEIWAKWGFMSLGKCFDFDWMHLQANP